MFKWFYVCAYWRNFNKYRILPYSYLESVVYYASYFFLDAGTWRNSGGYLVIFAIQKFDR
ncbi:hypothetical protein AW14_13995 [Siansivirga zeaxanthinifaciens CC-SAMT-1]|uniref:Uncharacterized protein n=1 Tax=Siansivirga zeaxanthinifaciens CC-SAMT-1 TaxID=1454006 RepID=A0A0C5WD41_9FLAO|nr:hypothetical protein AW14_13995 [Siansivirga zeaxanthinifaciens CC-SAMT-1]